MGNRVRAEGDACRIQLPHFAPGHARLSVELPTGGADERCWQEHCGHEAVFLEDRICINVEIAEPVVESDRDAPLTRLSGSQPLLHFAQSDCLVSMAA